jgi:hypothetical protein
MTTWEALETADAEMNGAEMGDLARLEASIGRRAGLIQSAVAEMEQLRRSGAPVPGESLLAMERSVNAGMRTMRQIILAKHMLATELGRLKQERQLLDSLSAAEPRTGVRVELRG